MNFRKLGALSCGLKKFCCTGQCEILTAVIVKIKIFQDVMPCSPVEIYQHSSKTLQYSCQTTPCHILKDGNLLLYRLKYFTYSMVHAGLSPMIIIPRASAISRASSEYG